MRSKALGLTLALLCAALHAGAVFAQIDFPELTGRVVDNADMLDEKTERVLTEQLAAHEQATGNQIVVVTLPGLQGHTIEDYGYQLGRHWQLGQKDKDNGALLIVAEEERKVRIEVGYGLEGELTDAVVSSIIHMVILPQFRQSDFNGGVSAGVTKIIEALGGQYVAPEREYSGQRDDGPSLATLVFLGVFVFIWILLAVLGGVGGGRGRRGHWGGGYYGGGFGGGGFGGGGGGFGGGGGSFGGGGASGGW